MVPVDYYSIVMGFFANNYDDDADDNNNNDDDDDDDNNNNNNIDMLLLDVFPVWRNFYKSRQSDFFAGGGVGLKRTARIASSKTLLIPF